MCSGLTVLIQTVATYVYYDGESWSFKQYAVYDSTEDVDGNEWGEEIQVNDHLGCAANFPDYIGRLR